ncbi:MAG TPA: S8 family serine peptidase, partial [Planctomycetia bacterium]|nr:S8 family serine peptidase [Planctomycetia bacterium]
MFARRSTFAWSLVAIFTAWTFPARDALAQGPKGGEEYAKRIRERLKGAKQLHIVKDKATSRSMSMAAARGALGTADDREGPREVTVGGEKLTVVELPIERDDQTSRAIAAAEEKAELTPLLFAITPELNDPPPAPSALSRSAGTGGGPEESVKIIGAPALWRKNLRGAGVVVAVVDTGVSRHSCFENRLDIANGAVFLNGRQPGSMIMDVKGHGTHVAGTIAGSEASGFGVAPESRILPIQVLDERGNGNELDIIRGVEYAIDNGAKVINLSLALVDNQGRPARTPIPERWREVAELALAKNVALIAAAGNSNATFVSAPASFPPPNVVGVGAVFLDGRRWSDPARGQGSNFGSGQFNASKPDISAPGVSIYSAHNRA